MDPDVPGGARVLVRPEVRAPRVGEVWVFVTLGGDVTVHRYLRRTRLGRLVFVGDRTETADAPVRPEWVVGRVELVDNAGNLRVLRRRDGIRPLAATIVRGAHRRLAGERADER